MRVGAVTLAVVALVVAVAAVTCSRAQDTAAPQPPARMAPPPPVVSPEVSSDGSVTFRLRAPEAENVRLSGSDIPGIGQGAAMVRDPQGVWEVTVGPLASGAYRYTFTVDGVSVVDPANTATSESNANTWSLVYVPGSADMDLRDVPHGAVAEVPYYSATLARFRRMHVYTPPGYESGEGSFPVLYLLHGAFDCDDTWSTVGRAGLILDNLIADGRAVPMVVVMPAGHTGPFSFGRPGGRAAGASGDEFVEDFVHDIRPHVEQRYRLSPGRANRAIAGLSMGGAQALAIAVRDLSDWGYIGVFSSGVFTIGGGPPASGAEAWEDEHRATLDDERLRQGLELIWFATGAEDFLLEVSRNTVGMFERHGFNVQYRETDGGHTWDNWRRYLVEFAQLLFRSAGSA